MKIDLPIKTKFGIQYTTDFKKDLKRINKQGKDIKKLNQIITRLANGEELEEKYKNHKLINNKYYYNCFECHIEPDLLLVYKYVNNDLIILLVNTGSHSELFNK